MRPDAVTVVVVPRERFSPSARSLDNLVRHTPADTPMVYVDGGSPPAVRDEIRRRCAARGIRLIRTEHYLSPNRARNLGFAEVTTPLVVFIDNDVLVHDGWLAALVDCADQTGAAVVGPLYCIGDADTIHMAGAELRFEEDGRRRIIERHRFVNRSAESVKSQLRREPTDMVEFHCMLVRSDVLRRLGGLDESLLSIAEYVDLCMLCRDLGRAVWIEPAARAVYVPPPPFEPFDRPFYALRWSRAWNASSAAHFARKWRLPADDTHTRSMAAWADEHLALAWRLPVRWLPRLRGSGLDRAWCSVVEAVSRRRYHTDRLLADRRIAPAAQL
jgi:GT2 family glycosyltransferase